MGNWQTITALSVLGSILFLSYRKRKLALSLLIAVWGSGVMTVIIKYLVGRVRPGISLAFYTEKLPSFPSAHAALIFAFFGFSIYCLWYFNLKLKAKIVLSLLALIIIILVGFSRVYLGVHFASDVIAGYLTGLFWLFIAMYVSRSYFS